MDTKWLLVDTPKKLQHAIDDFKRAKVLSIDTEYDSFAISKKYSVSSKFMLILQLMFLTL